MKEFNEEEVKQLRELLGYKVDIESIVQDKRAYARVAKKIKTMLAWLTFVIGSIALGHDKLIEFVKKLATGN